MDTIGVAMEQQCIKIERAANGYEVEVRDPEIVAKNRNSDRWRDPDVSYVFKTLDEVMTFIKDNADKLLTPQEDEYASGFQKALKE